ncbi:MAG: RNA polymerase factor sigma-54 [Pseudomonadota bacterium]
MKPALQLRVGQQLTMTPQLQQAIRLLQLSSLDLQAEIQEALDSNPLLEVSEEDENTISKEDSLKELNENDAISDTEELSYNENSALEVSSMDEFDSSDAMQKDTIDTDLPVDTQWEDYSSAPSVSLGPSDPDNDFDFQGKTTDSLHSHLMWQMQLTPFTEVDQVIATTIIDAINDEGYLTLTIEEIFEGLSANLSAEEELIDIDEVKTVLRRIQNFDPPGVGAGNLQECLLLQINLTLPTEDPVVELATRIIKDYIGDLGNKNYRNIFSKLKISEEQLRSVLKLIQTLNPKPGSDIAESQAEYITPDVYVFKKNARWQVELNPENAPKLRINSNYAGLIKRADSSQDNTYLKSNLQEAKWFLKSLQSRNETLLKVASCIVERQQAFLEYGDEAMKPLVLADIAETVEMHESTISRVTNQKYMHTPRGIFELKYFFSSHVSTANGGECSSTAIRALIKKLIAAEAPKKPLSDNKIAQILEEQGIKVARRTVAKYREAMLIPPSNERKSLL